MYFDDDFNKNDVYQVSRGTSKEDNLFAIAGIPNSFRVLWTMRRSLGVTSRITAESSRWFDV